MTHLGTFLSNLMQEDNIDAKTLAERMDIHETVLSRLITGKRRSCNDRTKRKIVLGCSPRPIKQAHCLAAYLLDQTFPPHDKSVRITVSLHP